MVGAKIIYNPKENCHPVFLLNTCLNAALFLKIMYKIHIIYQIVLYSLRHSDWVI